MENAALQEQLNCVPVTETDNRSSWPRKLVWMLTKHNTQQPRGLEVSQSKLVQPLINRLLTKLLGIDRYPRPPLEPSHEFNPP